jgi:hypothetical protein
MNSSKLLPTWSGSRNFRYSGSIRTGVSIEFGANFHNKGQFNSVDLQRLLSHFKGKEVPLGTQHTSNPIPGSVAEWIRDNINRNRIMTSYLGPIFISEGLAEKNGVMISFF